MAKISYIESMHNRLKLTKKIIKSRIRNARKISGQCALSTGNPKDAQKFIRSSTFTVPKQEGNEIEASIINDCFGNTVKDASYSRPIMKLGCDAEDSLQLQCVSQHQVFVALRNIKTCSAMGPDGIPAFIIKEFAHAITPAITTFFNKSTESCIFLSLWKRAVIRGIWKGRGQKMTQPIIDLSQFYLLQPDNLRSWW